VQISFLLGPAGSGKTFRCLQEIREELIARPEGAPLILLAPKQATFQLERQLLQSSELSGYSRLFIFSFERLAEFVFESFRRPIPNLLSEQGRVMVLRAILHQTHSDLNIFGRSARRLGFAQELSDQLREFQQAGSTPETLRKMADEISGGLRDKLRDITLIFERYRAWLQRNCLEDADSLLTLAAELLETAKIPLKIGGVWLDGFAQMTPQERSLLGALVRNTEKAVLAFCVESSTPPRNSYSQWFLISQSFARCRADLEARFGLGSVSTIRLERDYDHNRFALSKPLADLEQFWSGTAVSEADPSAALKIVSCTNIESEATFCAREIIRFVRAGGRYREVGVLARSFENDYPHIFRRIFRKYGIPFFFDHREAVAHHPLAELTRSALRLGVFNWKHSDLFNALKSGLLHIRSIDVDELENEALAQGWDGQAWKSGFIMRDPRKTANHLDLLNQRRVRIIAPFIRLERQLSSACSGVQLAKAIRAFWKELEVEEQLETWSSEDPGEAFHLTVWEQINSWLDNLELAFAQQVSPLRDWLPILDSGLAGLSVGLIPPVLDHVLFGAVDRSRNPDLKLVFVVGANEGVFPARLSRVSLLGEEERLALFASGCELTRLPALQLSQEQFYGYIACSRARECLVLTYSQAALDGSALNPSRFVSQIKRIFPTLEEIAWDAPFRPEQLEHRCEMISLFGGIEEFSQLRMPSVSESLDPDVAQRLYGNELKIAVSSVERFASCPFRFFVEQGLGVRERKEFALDLREKGSFQHAVLAQFHRELQSERKRWRDISRDDAMARIARLVDEQIESFSGGLLAMSSENRFIGETYKAALQDFIGSVMDWFRTNEFDPEEVELPFGYENQLPGWRVPLETGQMLIMCGRVDRVDVLRQGGRALCVVMDYKSGQQQVDRVLVENGIQQQLPAYLLGLTRLPEVRQMFKVDEVVAAGCFLIPLRAKYENEGNRNEVFGDRDRPRKSAYTHSGFFDLEHLSALDRNHSVEKSLQFQYAITKNGVPKKGSFNALESADFAALLRHSEGLLRNFGRRIYQGDISISPYKKSQKTACDQCQCQPVCRFDPWVQKYNVLNNAER
jgi:ATP-dependent helicase/nuclease subunit B